LYFGVENSIFKIFFNLLFNVPRAVEVMAMGVGERRDDKAVFEINDFINPSRFLFRQETID
jgi:hypothetical protein